MYIYALINYSYSIIKVGGLSPHTFKSGGAIVPSAPPPPSYAYAVYVLVQLYAFFENVNRNLPDSVEARITIRMGTEHIFDTNNIWYTYGIACLMWTKRHIIGANIIHISSIEWSSIYDSYRLLIFFVPNMCT